MPTSGRKMAPKSPICSKSDETEETTRNSQCIISIYLPKRSREYQRTPLLGGFYRLRNVLRRVIPTGRRQHDIDIPQDYQNRQGRHGRNRHVYSIISCTYKYITLGLLPMQRFRLISPIMAIPSGKLSSEANYIVSILNIQAGASQSLYFVEPTGELSGVPVRYRKDKALHARIKLAPSIGPEDQIAYVSGRGAGKFNAVSQYRKYRALLSVM